MEGPSGVKTKRSAPLNSKVHEAQAAHRLGEVQFVQFQHCLENIMNRVSPFWITALRHPQRCPTPLCAVLRWGSCYLAYCGHYILVLLSAEEFLDAEVQLL